MDLGIDGRVALVTGASRGLARGIAEGLVAEGARVAIASRDAERTAEAAAAIGARPFTYDSFAYESAAGLIASVQRELGPIEILVTSTGGPPAGPEPLGFEESEWEAAYRTLLRSPLELIRAAVPGMRDRGFGRVVNIASSTVREPAPALMLSNSLRAATLAAFKTLARDVAEDGVTINSLLPGRIGTARLHELFGSREAAETLGTAEIPAGRLGTVAEFAAAGVFLCSTQAAYITGIALLVDGGLTHLV